MELIELNGRDGYTAVCKSVCVCVCSRRSDDVAEPRKEISPWIDLRIDAGHVLFTFVIPIVDRYGNQLKKEGEISHKIDQIT